jgi:RNA polymerase sigma-70 factor, ECF subfamily
VRWDWAALRRESIAVARRVAPHGVDADDVAQEAVLRAWRCRASCRAPDAAAWMRRIAVNEALRAARREPRHAGLDDVAIAAGPDPAVESLPDRVRVADAVRLLQPLDRRLIALRYGADLTQAEIAVVLGMPEGTVKVRLHRARRALAERMEGT